MQVALIGGTKVEQIQAAVQKSFKSNVVVLICYQYLQELYVGISQGESFERVVITETMFMENDEMLSPSEVRAMMEKFADYLVSLPYEMEFVFILTDNTLAEIVEEEMYNYYAKLKIVRLTGKYTVKLIEEVCTNDLIHIKDEWGRISNTKVDTSQAVTPATSPEDVAEYENDYTEERRVDLGDNMDANAPQDDYRAEDVFPYADTTTYSEGEYEEEVYQEEALPGEDTPPIETPTFYPPKEEPKKSKKTKHNGFDFPFGKKTKKGNKANDKGNPKPFVADEMVYTPDETYQPDQVVTDSPLLTKETLDSSASDMYLDKPSEPIYYPAENTVENKPSLNVGTSANPQENVDQEEMSDTENEPTSIVQDEYPAYTNPFAADMYMQPNQEVTSFETETPIQEENEPFTEDTMTPNHDVSETFGDDFYTQAATQEPTTENTAPTPSVIPSEPVQQPIGSKLTKPSKNKGKLGDLFNKKNTPTVPIPTPTQVPMDISTDTDDTFSSDLYSQGGVDLTQATNLNATELKNMQTMLAKLSSRKASFVFSGLPNTGSTTLAYNTATLLSQLGFSVLLVDCDAYYHAMSYVKKDIYNIVHTSRDTSSNLVQAINNPTATPSLTHVIGQGLHLLTLGLDQDATSLNTLVDKQRFTRFSGIVKSNYHFVVYDLPFTVLTGIGEELAFNCDALMLTCDANTQGLMKLMSVLGNIENDELRVVLFTKVKIILNKYFKNTVFFGKKTNNQEDIFKCLDTIATQITGETGDYLFRDLNVISCIDYNPQFANAVYTNQSLVKENLIKQTLYALLNSIIIS